MAKMDERLEKMVERYREINDLMMQSDVVSDRKTMAKLGREQNELTPIVETYEEYKKAVDELEEAKVLSKEEDKEIREMAQMELEELEPKIQNYLDRLELLLVPKDPNDSHNAILEIRGAAGGDEGNIFAGDLFRMYSKYAEAKGWRIEVIEMEDSEAGGFSLVSFKVNGEGAYGILKFESGSHRVQRVPKTESQGRIHTSTATVLCMPEVEAEDFDIDMNDLEIETMRSSGAGGQHINKTDSAVRMVHKPTGILATCQNGRSQHENREECLRVLKSRLYQLEIEEQEKKIAQIKGVQSANEWGSQIRSYVMHPYSLVKDVRTGYETSQVQSVLDGDLDEFIFAYLKSQIQ